MLFMRSSVLFVSAVLCLVFRSFSVLDRPTTQKFRAMSDWGGFGGIWAESLLPRLVLNDFATLVM